MWYSWKEESSTDGNLHVKHTGQRAALLIWTAVTKINIKKKQIWLHFLYFDSGQKSMTRFMSNLFTTPVFCFYLSLKKSVALLSKKPGSSSLENISYLFSFLFFFFLHLANWSWRIYCCPCIFTNYLLSPLRESWTPSSKWNGKCLRFAPDRQTDRQTDGRTNDNRGSESCRTMFCGKEKKYIQKV